MKKIIFVHGFGVLKDARGMFLEIENFLKNENYECVLFNLNDLDEKGDIVVNQFSEQVLRLKEVWLKEKDDSEVSIIAHSQGCIIAALANLDDIEQTILLAPPIDSQSQKTIDYFKTKPGTMIVKDGVSKLARSDGSFTVVPSLYWNEKDNVDTKAIFRNYIANHNTSVIRAIKDEVISNEGTSDLFKDLIIKDIETGHNFEGEGRLRLLKEIKSLLAK